MEMNITFPGGKRVDAEFMGQVVRTDQGPAGGGDGSAPEPFMHFLASIGTCAGIYVLGFCQARGLPTDQINLTQHMDFEGYRLARVRLEIHVPADFPEKYRPALERVANMCAVKKAILEPPAFEISTVVDQAQAAQAV